MLVTGAANVGTHFILNNLFTFAWILLWTRSHFWGAEIILIAHFINQHATYWRHRTLSPLAHLSAVAAPFAWTLIALFWNGAVAVKGETPLEHRTLARKTSSVGQLLRALRVK